MAKLINVPLSKIYLDNGNPRHEVIDNEEDLIANLVKKERVLALAQDIAVHGLSPIERLAVVRHPKVSSAYLVVEGNRRLCALKLLRDPRRAPTAKVRDAFQKLRQGAKQSAEIEVALFENTEEARHWMKVRHLGEQEGVGVRKWNAEQKARFDDGSSGANPNSLALELMDYAAKASLINAEDRSRISITTLTRYLSNPLVRDAIGITSRHALEIDAPQDEFDVAAKAFLEDAAQEDDPPVHSRSGKDDRVAYAASLRTRGVARKSRITEAVVPSAIVSKRKNRHSQNPDHRSRIVPPSFRAKIKDRLLKRIFDELRTIDPNLSFAGIYLLRSFVERLANLYAKENRLGDGRLHAVLGKCVKHLESNSQLISEFGQARLNRLTKNLRVAASNSDHWLSPDTLGHLAHGGDTPTASDLKRRWDGLEDSISLLLRGLH